MAIFGREVPESQICIIRGKHTKYEVLDRLISLVSKSPAIKDPEGFRKAVLEREEITSTGIGGGIAVPHARMDEIEDIIIGLAIVPEGVDFDSIDNQPVYIVLLYATPKTKDKEYLQLLAKTVQTLKSSTVCNRLLKCQSPQQVALYINANNSL
ncbi:MAG: PTS sugar transporter subunit IIA [Candidatus Hydrogenedentes bacterium]|nr:PTS sugar transporter subunit IIA [Candidatus Hydrogenedentota bacterium]